VVWNLGGVEPDGIKGVEVEGRVGAVEDRPRAQLRGREPRDDDPRELPVIELRAAVGPGRQRHRRQQRSRDGEVAASALPRRHHEPGRFVRCSGPVPPSGWLASRPRTGMWSGKGEAEAGRSGPFVLSEDRQLGGSLYRLRCSLTPWGPNSGERVEFGWRRGGHLCRPLSKDGRDRRLPQAEGTEDGQSYHQYQLGGRELAVRASHVRGVCPSRPCALNLGALRCEPTVWILPGPAGKGSVTDKSVVAALPGLAQL